MQTLWLVRHAHRLDFVQPEWFETAIYPYDPPLSDQGGDRAIDLALQFSQVPIDRIFTSPFLRTIQTAAPLAKLLRLPIRLEWGLCEWLCQDWTLGFPATTPIADLIKSYPNIDADYQSLVMPCYPETTKELDARLHIIAHELVRDNSLTTLAIAHKGSVLGIVAALTGENHWQTYDLPCGGIIKLVCADGRWISSVVDG
jgi:broad specificity phosphatase PhoE